MGSSVWPTLSSKAWNSKDEPRGVVRTGASVGDWKCIEHHMGSELVSTTSIRMSIS